MRGVLVRYRLERYGGVRSFPAFPPELRAVRCCWCGTEAQHALTWTSVSGRRNYDCVCGKCLARMGAPWGDAMRLRDAVDEALTVQVHEA